MISFPPISDFIIYEPEEYGIMYKVWMAIILIVNGATCLAATISTFMAPWLYWKSTGERLKKYMDEKDKSDSG